jgi:hypothetical protein
LYAPVANRTCWGCSAQHKSVFAPRRKDADSHGYLNGKNTYSRAFTLDFGMLQIKGGLSKAVGGPDVMLQLQPVMLEHYKTLRLVYEEYCAVRFRTT